ncbi:MAG: MptD family putative ECF transporter S component [Actinomycetaceae bacterium]|nr:MptD family putative ECF transporter S component [Actinomycetaceae bacterium]
MKFSLTTRDLINVGIFTVIYFLCQFTPGMLGLAGPQFMLLGIVLAIFFCGIVAVFYMARVNKMGAMTILGAICGLLFVLTGHTAWLLVGGTVLGFIADMIHSKLGFSERLSPARAIAAYVVFSLIVLVALEPMLFNSDAYFKAIEGEMGADFAHNYRAFFTPQLILTFVPISMFLSFVAGWIGVKVNKKHFSKAGLIKS